MALAAAFQEYLHQKETARNPIDGTAGGKKGAR